MNPGLEKIQGYINTLGLSNEQVSEDVWVIDDAAKGLNKIVVFVDEALVTLRCRVMDIPTLKLEDRLRLFEVLLRFNLDLVHGAFALEEEHIILMDTLELDGMDLEEFQASLDALGLAMAQYYPELSRFR